MRAYSTTFTAISPSSLPERQQAMPAARDVPGFKNTPRFISWCTGEISFFRYRGMKTKQKSCRIGGGIFALYPSSHHACVLNPWHFSDHEAVTDRKKRGGARGSCASPSRFLYPRCAAGLVSPARRAFDHSCGSAARLPLSSAMASSRETHSANRSGQTSLK